MGWLLGFALSPHFYNDHIRTRINSRKPFPWHISSDSIWPKTNGLSNTPVQTLDIHINGISNFCGYGVPDTPTHYVHECTEYVWKSNREKDSQVGTRAIKVTTRGSLHQNTMCEDTHNAPCKCRRTDFAFFSTSKMSNNGNHGSHVSSDTPSPPPDGFLPLPDDFHLIRQMFGSYQRGVSIMNPYNPFNHGCDDPHFELYPTLTPSQTNDFPSCKVSWKVWSSTHIHTIPRSQVYVRWVDPSILTFTLSSHRHPHICHNSGIGFPSIIVFYNSLVISIDMTSDKLWTLKPSSSDGGQGRDYLDTGRLQYVNTGSFAQLSKVSFPLSSFLSTVIHQWRSDSLRVLSTFDGGDLNFCILGPSSRSVFTSRVDGLLTVPHF